MRYAPALIPIVLLTAGVPGAAAKVSTPRVVSPAGLMVQDQAVGAGGGRTAVLMTGYHGSSPNTRFSVTARVGTSPHLGRSQRLSTRRGERPQAAVGADGTAVVAWVEGNDGPRVAVARPGHPFGAVHTLRATTADESSPRPPVVLGGVAVTSDGRAVVAWRAGSSLDVATADAGKGFGPTRVLGTIRQQTPAVTAGAGATVVVTWLDTPAPPTPSSPGPVDPARLMTATIVPGGTTVENALASMSYWGSRIFRAGTGPGGVAVTWAQDGWLSLTRVNGHGGVSAPTVAFAGWPGGGFGVATSADGTATEVWRTVDVDLRDEESFSAARVYATDVGTARDVATGPVDGTPALLSTIGWLPEEPGLVALANRMVGVWSASQPKRNPRVQIVTHRAGQPWNRLRAIPAPGLDPGSLEAAGSKHRVAITWTRAVTKRERSGPLYLLEYRG